jgi:hypothetical protein
MKTNRIILTIVFCLVVFIAAMLAKQRHPTVKLPSNVSGGIATNSGRPTTNQIQVTEANVNTNAASEKDYFKKIVDPETGQYAIIGLDKLTVILRDKDGRVIWNVNLSNEMSGLEYSIEQHLSGGYFYKSKSLSVLSLEIGTSSVFLDIHTGKSAGAILH